jgi:hypothetical protein
MNSRAGQRIGDWFLWIECEIAKTDKYRKVPIVTLRDATMGGDVISTVVASAGMVKELRAVADNIEGVLADLNSHQSNECSGE